MKKMDYKRAKLLTAALMAGALFSAPVMADSTTVNTWSEFQTAVNNSNITDISVNNNITYESVVQNIAYPRNLSIIGTTTGKFLNGASGLNGFIVNSGATLNISGLTMRGFRADNGGAIKNYGLNMSITGATDTEGNIVAFEGNSATGVGGAIYLTNGNISSIIGDFKSNSAKEGGAIYSSKTIEGITGDFIANHANKGGAIYVDYSSVYIKAIDDNIKFDGNYVTGSTQGGAIYNDGDNNVYLYAADGKSITFTGNRTGLPTEAANVDGIYNRGYLNINGNGTDTYTGTVNLYTVSDDVIKNGETNIYGGTVNVKDTLNQCKLNLKGGTLNLGRNATVGNFDITEGAKLSLSIPDGTFENYENEINKLTTGFYSGVLSDLTVDYDATAAEGSNMDKIIIDGAGSGSVAPNSSIKLTSVNVIKDGNTLNNGIFLTGTPAGTLDNLADNTETTSTTTSSGYKYTFTPTSKGVVSVTREVGKTLADEIQDENGSDTFSVNTNPYMTGEDLGSLAGENRNFTIYGNGNTIDGTNPAGGKFDGITIGNSSGQEFTLENATMQNFTTAITNKAGATANVNGVTFTNNTTDIANDGTLNLSGANTIDTITGTGSTEIKSSTTTINNSITQNVINVNSGATLSSTANDVRIAASDTFINNGTVNMSGDNSELAANNLTNGGTITVSGANSLIKTGQITNNGIIDTVGLVGNLTNNGTVTTSGVIEAAIQNNANGSVTINGDEGKIMVLDNWGTANINGKLDAEGSIIQLTQNDGGIMNFSTDAINSTANRPINSFTMNGGLVNIADGNVNTLHINQLNLAGNTNFAMDADLAAGSMDKIQIHDVNNSNITEGKVININKINLLSDATQEKINLSIFADDDTRDALKNNVHSNINGLQYSPIYKYNALYNSADGTIGFTRYNSGGYDDFNPSVMVTPVAAQMGGYLTLLNSYEDAFANMDMTMLMTKAERTALKQRNKYAAADESNLTTFSPNQIPEENAGVWFRPFASFEKVDLSHGPEVGNNSYGALLGFDSQIYELKNGWDAIFTGYAGYNGSHQHYDGNSIWQNGGQLGATAVFYKGDFFTGLTATTGASVGDANTMYGREDITMLMAGVANKTGYNWELFNGKFIIQPSMLMSYSFVNTFDHHNAAGVDINSDPLHAIQIAPGLKFMGNLPHGWQPYVGVQMVWNIMDKTKVSANNISLPETSVDPYVQYGVGVQKRWGEKFTGFLQAMIRNGGRTGISLSAGFRWALGKAPNKMDKSAGVQKSTERNIRLTAK